MTKDQFRKKLETKGAHLPVYWVEEEILEWLWSLLDPKYKEE